MTRECIEDFREIILPFARNVLLKINYENLGKSDAEEFTRDFNEILDMAIKTLERESCEDCISRQFMYELGATCIATRNENGELIALGAIKELPSVAPQEPKIKVLERDEAMRKLGAVDIYQASAWITLLNDLEYLKLKICEVEE